MGATRISEADGSHVEILHRISGIVSSNLSVDEMLGEVIALAAQATSCDACLAYLIDRQAGELVLRASLLPHAADLGSLRMKIGEGVAGWVVENNSVVALASNAARDPRFKRFQELVEDTYEAFLSAPLVNAGEVIGVVNVHHREPHEHSAEEIATVAFIGEQLGVAISKSLLEEQAGRLLEETLGMKRELETRKLVERAKGILQLKHGISEEESYLRLRNQSRRLRRPMK
ncbi:MAG: GAF domain-containing protein, partial [Bryobacteraceae bacterium]